MKIKRDTIDTKRNKEKERPRIEREKERERDRDREYRKTQSERKKRKREAKTMKKEAAHHVGKKDRQTQREDGGNRKTKC